MTPRLFLRLQDRARQAGAGLVTAIFLLVVLAGLAVALVTIFGTQRQSAALDEQGARAYQAARAGLEWGLFQDLRNNTCNASSSFALPAGTSLSGFTVVVSCIKKGATNGLLQVVITSVACNIADAQGNCTALPNPEWVSRTVETQLTQPVESGS